MPDDHSLYFELKDGTVNRETGEKSGAGIRVSVPLTVREVAQAIHLPITRISSISEEQYNAEYADEKGEE